MGGQRQAVEVPDVCASTMHVQRSQLRSLAWAMWESPWSWKKMKINYSGGSYDGSQQSWVSLATTGRVYGRVSDNHKQDSIFGIEPNGEICSTRRNLQRRIAMQVSFIIYFRRRYNHKEHHSPPKWWHLIHLLVFTPGLTMNLTLSPSISVFPLYRRRQRRTRIITSMPLLINRKVIITISTSCTIA